MPVTAKQDLASAPVLQKLAELAKTGMSALTPHVGAGIARPAA